jgi:hypothetical protein
MDVIASPQSHVCHRLLLVLMVSPFGQQGMAANRSRPASSVAPASRGKRKTRRQAGQLRQHPYNR